MSGSPITSRWSGEAMEPLPRFHNAANAQFVVGETYTLAEVQERSDSSHRHYFVMVKTAWENLPETHATQPWAQSPEHLRKYCLIRTGYSDSHTLVCSSKAEALRVARFMRPIDEYAVITVQGTTVTRYTAQSQSYRAMGKEEFQRSKEMVLDQLARLLDVSREAFTQPAGMAA